MRHERRSITMESLAAHMDDMVSVVERRRRYNEEAHGERRLKESVTVMVWEEADGSETVTVIGDPEMPALQMKGVLHDGLYAVAHEDEDTRVG